MYNELKLYNELVAAGLPVIGAGFDGRIDWLTPPNAEQIALANNILAAHDSEDWQMSLDRDTVAGGTGQAATITIRAVDYLRRPLVGVTSATVNVNGVAQVVVLDAGVGYLQITVDLPRSVVVVEGTGKLIGLSARVYAI